MSVSSGFFNSELADRLYDATDFNKLVGSILVEGVIPFGGNLLVEENTGLTVNVQTGRAWFLDSWINNDAVLPITLDTADAAYNRYDIVALDFDVRQVTRLNTIVVIKGNAAASPVLPTLVDDDDHKQYPLAVITVPAAATDIYQSNIENKVGTGECPFASGVLQQANVDELLSQWSTQFNDWFDNLIDELDTNQASNLQAQIDVIEQRHWPFKNLLNNGRFQVSQKPGALSEILAGPPLVPYGGPDRWKLSIANTPAGITPSTEARLDGGVNRRWYKLTCTTAGPVLDQYTYVQLQQRIEGNMLGNIYTGTTYARPLTLSFLFRSNKTGTYVVELHDINNHITCSKSFTYSVADTTQKVVLTYPPNVTVPWSTWSSESLRVNFWLAAGSIYTTGTLATSWSAENNSNRVVGQVNLMSAVNNYVSYTDMQLEIGSEATEYERLPDHVELANCRRYLYGIYTTDQSRWINVFVNGAPSKDYVQFPWPVVMRAVPTVYFTWRQQGVGSGWDFYCTNDTMRTYINEKHTKEQFAYHTNSGSNGSSGYTYFCEMTYLYADADL